MRIFALTLFVKLMRDVRVTEETKYKLNILQFFLQYLNFDIFFLKLNVQNMFR